MNTTLNQSGIFDSNRYMLTYADIEVHKEALIFELDDVLFPKRDYLLQVYYLFAHLLEYTETSPPANDLTGFLKTAYEHHGEEGLFERAAEIFAIDSKYKVQFDRLHLTAQLPARLLLFQPMLELIQLAHESGKRLLILTEGNPAMQLNKLRHVEWHGLDKVMKVYFQEELHAKGLEPLGYLLGGNGLRASDVLYIHTGDKPVLALALAVDCIRAERFWTPSATSTHQS